jgi:NADH dehydrogenase
MLGRAIVGQALEAGHRVVVATRTPASASGRLPDGVEVRRGDLTQLTSLPDVVRDVEVVIASAHGMLGRGASRSELVDDRGHRALIDAAKSADVGSFVYVSVMGASPAHSVDFWRTKAGIEAYLRASGLRFTIVRPAAFMEMHAHTLIGQAILAGGTANILGRGDVRMNFVAVRDVAAVIVRALRDPALHHQAVEVGGPENLTQNEVAALYGRIAGREPKVRHVPYELVHVLATVLGAFHPGIARIMRASLAARATDQTFDPSALLSAHPMVLTRLEDVARELAAGTSAGARGGGASVSSSSP